MEFRLTFYGTFGFAVKIFTSTAINNLYFYFPDKNIISAGDIRSDLTRLRIYFNFSDFSLFAINMLFRYFFFVHFFLVLNDDEFNPGNKMSSESVIFVYIYKKLISSLIYFSFGIFFNPKNYWVAFSLQCMNDIGGVLISLKSCLVSAEHCNV